jgi:5-deoxy-glucuronate isomerase
MKPVRTKRPLSFWAETRIFTFDAVRWENVGGRRNVFEGKAHSVYMPRYKKVTITGKTNVKIAAAGTKTKEDTEAQLLGPRQYEALSLG